MLWQLWLVRNANLMHRRSKHFCSGEAIGGIKTVSCSVQVLGGYGGMPPPKNVQDFRHSQIESGAILGVKYELQ